MAIKKFEKLMQDSKSAKAPPEMKRKSAAPAKKMDAYAKGGAVAKNSRTPC
jgi:hypothetical protein